MTPTDIQAEAERIAAKLASLYFGPDEQTERQEMAARVMKYVGGDIVALADRVQEGQKEQLKLIMVSALARSVRGAMGFMKPLRPSGPGKSERGAMGESNYRGDLSAPMQLDDKGRCCGRKPLVYKRPEHRFCFRCNRAYHLIQNFQIDNWAWKRRADGQFEYSSGRERIAKEPSRP